MDIPNKLYVARRFVSGDEIVGYVIIADKEHTKAFQTKKDKYDKYGNMPSITIDNTPQKGFAVVQKLNTYARETYFTVRHAEGFEFQISAKNMNDLIMNNNIINGVFQDSMYFNSSLELINGNTKTFARMEAKAKQEEERADTVASLKTGDGFKYGNNEFYYCGEVHALCVNKTKDFALTDKSSKYHLIYNSTEDYYVINDKMEKRDIKVLASLNKKVTLEDEIKKANEQFQTPVKHKSVSLHEYANPVLISSKSFKKKDLKLKYEEIDSVGRFNENVVFMTKETKNDVETTYRVFFGLNTSTYQSSYYRNDDYHIVYDGAYDVYCAYPCELDENGIMSMDVDINDHKSFSTWRGYQSPFYPPTKKYDSYRNNYSNTKPMKQVSKTNKLYVGKYYI